jgi:hypothetical protein
MSEKSLHVMFMLCSFNIEIVGMGEPGSFTGVVAPFCFLPLLTYHLMLGGWETQKVMSNLT